MSESKVKKLEFYVTKTGLVPFVEWFDSIKDDKFRLRIQMKLDRVSMGNMGDCKYLSEGVSEFRLDFGPGYRLYFAATDNDIILLLCGGHKSSQRKDIKRAIIYWKDYQARHQDEKKHSK